MATPSTLAAARTQYTDNADYANGAGDVTAAREFRTACTALLVLLPESAASGGQSVTMEMGLIAKQLDRADKWLAENDTGQTSGNRGAIALVRRASV